MEVKEQVEAGEREKVEVQVPVTQEVDTKPELQQWNSPRINTYRYLVANFGFIIIGMNDAAYGALIPYLEAYYDISYTVVSLVFLAPFVGYTLAALLNNRIHLRFGQRGVAVISPLCKLLSHVITCIHPPYPVLPVIFIFSGFANGLEDGAWNAWIGNLQHSNELLGILHGSYGLGGTISPLIATAMVTKGNLPWYTFYYLMAGLALTELLVSTISFRTATGAAYRAANPQTHAQSSSDDVNGGTPARTRSHTREALQQPVTWICAILLLLYVGVGVSLGGWLVTFMLRVRHGAPFAAGMVATGFWLGLTAGRVALGFVTGRVLGEKLAIAAYLLACAGLQLCFWLVRSFAGSAVCAALLGFFLGPLFPAAIVVATKLLPRRLHVSAIGFVAAFGSGGAALLPFAVGAIAQARGVEVLQPIVLANIVAILALWCLLPGGFRKGGLDEVQRLREERAAGRAEEGGGGGSGGSGVEGRGLTRGVYKVRRKLGLA